MQSVIIYKNEYIIAYKPHEHNNARNPCEAFSFTERADEYKNRSRKRNKSAYKPFGREQKSVFRSYRTEPAYEQNIGDVASYNVARSYSDVAFARGGNRRDKLG